MLSSAIAGGRNRRRGIGRGGGAGAPVDPPALIGKGCDGKPFELNGTLVRECEVLFASCGAIADTSDCIASGVDGVSFHFSKGAAKLPFQFDARVARCGELSANCDDVLACTGSRLPTTECDVDTASRCDGERAINCTTEPSVVDCTENDRQKRRLSDLRQRARCTRRVRRHR